VADTLPSVEQALVELQRLARLPDDGELRVAGAVPADLAEPGKERLLLDPAGREGLEALRAALPEDLRFEYLKDEEVTATTVRFACLACMRPDDDHVPSFIAEHAREPMTRTCRLSVLHLEVTEELELPGATLVPAEDAGLPNPMLGPDPKPTMGCAIAIECVGTNYNKMTLRAEAVAEHALRLLRAGIREERFTPDRELMFVLGESVWFDDGASGWKGGKNASFNYAVDAQTVQNALSVPVAALPMTGGTDIETRASRALKWWERAHFAEDPLIELLFLFFALEAILGSDRVGPKARPLALRRAILAHRTKDHFAHPYRVYGLYRDVRNAAVHGGEAPELAERDVHDFSWDVRRALNEYLEFAWNQHVADRVALLAVLDADPDADRIAEEFLPPER
jgi:hypothetical protein